MPFTLNDLSLDIAQETTINAPIERVFDTLIRRLSHDNSAPDNTPMPMVLEAWPGGRWYRDLGDDQGHLWGFVQVIKRPTLLEIHGPMFMSYAVAGHVQLRLTPSDAGVVFSLRHRVFGLIEPGHREGVVPGWSFMLAKVKEESEAASA